MSVEKVVRANGHVWRVRWRDDTGQARSKVLGTKRDAEAFDAEIKRLKRTGDLESLVKERPTLAGFVTVWWERYAVPHLSARTRRSYAGIWDRHLLPYLGDVRLNRVTVDLVEQHIAGLRSQGLGDPTIYRVLMLLQGIMQRAVEWGYTSTNHVRAVRKPSIKRQRMVRPLTEGQVADIIAKCPSLQDSLIVSLMANEGLRPQEVFALDWQDIQSGKVVVDKATDYDGTVKTTKTETHRVVPLSGVTTRILSAIRQSETVVHDKPIVYRVYGRGRWTDGVWQNWHRDVWRHVRPSEGVRPYDLRHTFVSRLIAEGENVIQVAKLAGHSPTMTMEVYGHLFDD